MPIHLTVPAFLALLLPATVTAAVEESPYQVISSDGNFEVRDYASQIVAEVEVTASIEDAGNEAFGLLFDYISGNNQSRSDIAMTAPVSQAADGEKIAMTSPVSQKAAGNFWVVSFTMPPDYSMESLPRPDNPLVRLREIPPRRMAAVRYSGLWSEKNYRQHETELMQWIRAQRLDPTGGPVWARYDPPFMPWFLRRNEILVPVKVTTQN